MGGKNETKISGLRMHVSNGDVHIHDDAKNLKFETPCRTFKTEVGEAFETLKSDGIYEIAGKKDSLCIMRSGRTISMFVKDGNGIKQKLQAFLREC